MDCVRFNEKIIAALCDKRIYIRCRKKMIESNISVFMFILFNHTFHGEKRSKIEKSLARRW